MYSRHSCILDQNKRIANVNKIQTLLKTTKIQHFYYSKLKSVDTIGNRIRKIDEQ